MLSQGGPADSTLSIGHGSRGIIELLQKSFPRFNFDHELIFPNNIKEKTVKNPNGRDVEEIPNYHFRDDGLALWKAIRSYVEDVINVFYETDEDVQEDHELQEWEMEIYK